MRSPQRSGSKIKDLEEILKVFEIWIPKDIQSEREEIQIKKCGYERSVRKDSVLYGIKIPFKEFIVAIKLFDLELSVRKASRELGLSYNTTHKIFRLIRQKIYQHCSSDNVLKGGSRSI